MTTDLRRSTTVARLARGLILLTAAAVAVAACSGGSRDTDDSGEAPPPEGNVVQVAGVQFNPDGAALSPDNARIAVPCESRLCVWSTANGELLAEYDGDNAATWTPDGTRLVTSKGPQVIVLDAATGAEVRALDGHTGHTASETNDDAGLVIWDVAVAGDGTIASAGADGTVRLWGEDGTAEGTLEPGTEWPTDLAFSPDSKQLAISNVDAPLEIWDVAKASKLADLGTEPQGPVAWSPDGSSLATATAKPGGEAQVRIWDSVTYDLLDQLAIGATSVAFSPDGKQLALTEASNSDVILWTIGGATPTRLDGTLEVLGSALWSADGKAIYTAGIKDGVRVWDIAAGTPSEPFALPTAD